MKVKELVGKDIMMAYDGDYLSTDFGYSCANYNTKFGHFGGEQDWRFFDSYRYKSHSATENDEATFDFYTINKKNVSCFACFNNAGKICGRRMFFKGPSMINDKELENPLKKGELVKYLYGYYGNRDGITQKEIGMAVMSRYGKGILYTDHEVFNNRIRDHEVPNYWIMEVQRTNFNKYPPIDLLSVSTEISALSNFDPRYYIISILEKDYKKKGITFHRAYRFDLANVNKRHNYTTWSDHQGVVKSYKDLIKDLTDEEEEDDEDIKPNNQDTKLLPPPKKED